MNIAVLILAHKNPEQLKMLVNRLCQDFRVYIHLDQKFKLPQNFFSDSGNVTVIQKYAVNWGSYNQILATYELLQASFQDKNEYFLFISGQDLPTKPNREIIDFIAANRDTNFLNYDELPNRSWLAQGGENGGLDRVELFWPNNFEQRGIGYLGRKALKTVRFFQKNLNLKRKLYPITYYSGWNWFNLNQEAVSVILDFTRKNPDFLASFRFTNCADEIWLQTILLNTDCKVINNNLRFLSWEEGSANPKTLTLPFLEAILISEALFARKFDINLDKKVVDEIYRLTEK